MMQCILMELLGTNFDIVYIVWCIAFQESFLVEPLPILNFL